MYQPFKLTQPEEPVNFMESFTLDGPWNEREEKVTSFFTEAYFAEGRKSLQPVVDEFQKVKDTLEADLAAKGRKWSWQDFQRNLSLKSFEDVLRKVFGFRDVEIVNDAGDYVPGKDMFTTHLNAFTYPGTNWRWPIDGLVTDKGFYDSTHSLRMLVFFTPGIIKVLTAEELTAVFLHEFGHNIDPALVDINYVKANQLSEYLTDRDKSGDSEPGNVPGASNDWLWDPAVIFTFIILTFGLAIIPYLIGGIVKLCKAISWSPEKALDKIKGMIRRDSSKFDRVHSCEAFADNFPRMYGFGPESMAAFDKMSRYYSKLREGRIKKEKKRQKAIASMTMSTIADSHKTDIHRIYALIKEYEADLADKTIPAKVKKDIAKDLNEIKLVLNKYLNERSDFENKVNQLILQELKRLDKRNDDLGEQPSTEATFEEISNEEFQKLADGDKDRRKWENRHKDRCVKCPKCKSRIVVESVNNTCPDCGEPLNESLSGTATLVVLIGAIVAAGIKVWANNRKRKKLDREKQKKSEDKYGDLKKGIEVTLKRYLPSMKKVSDSLESVWKKYSADDMLGAYIEAYDPEDSHAEMYMMVKDSKLYLSFIAITLTKSYADIWVVDKNNEEVHPDKILDDLEKDLKKYVSDKLPKLVADEEILFHFDNDYYSIEMLVPFQKIDVGS